MSEGIQVFLSEQCFGPDCRFASQWIQWYSLIQSSFFAYTLRNSIEYCNNFIYFQTIGSCPKAETEREDAYTAFLEEDAANITELIDMVYNETGEVVDSVGLSAMYEKLLSEVWTHDHTIKTIYFTSYAGGAILMVFLVTSK